MPGLLHIYDDTMGSNYVTSFIARNAAETIGVSTDKEFWKALDGLIASGKTFDAMVVSTHGAQAGIFFGDNSAIMAGDLHQRIGGTYWKLFPSYAKIYYAGCSIMEDDGQGRRFLKLTGEVFLRSAGGIVMAHETEGWVVGGWSQRLLILGVKWFLWPPALSTASTDALIWFGLKGKNWRSPWDQLTAMVFAPGGIVAATSKRPSWLAK